MTRSERLAEQLDWHWRTNLRPRLDGLADVIHHGAEISLLRDLYRWQDGAAPRRL